MTIRNTRQLGVAIQKERRRQGLTQTQLAERAGLRQQTISGVESGKPRSQLRVIFDIMAALDLEIQLTLRSAKSGPDLEDIF